MKIRRTFHIPDAILLEHAEVMAARLPDDLPDFTRFDSTINEAYVDLIHQAIDEAKAFQPDYVIKSEVAEQTELVKKALDDCFDDFKTIAYFVRKVFGADPAIRNQFKINDVAKSRKDKAEMHMLMELIYRAAMEYRDELTQAGCPDAVISGLPDKISALNDAILTQESAKKERKLTTDKRIQALNKVYELVRSLYDVAQHIYRNDVRLKIYTVPQPAKPKASAPTPKETDKPEQTHETPEKVW